jgi:hypothetical protein
MRCPRWGDVLVVVSFLNPGCERVPRSGDGKGRARSPHCHRSYHLAPLVSVDLSQRPPLANRLVHDTESALGRTAGGGRNRADRSS